MVRERRVATAIRFDPAIHETLKETAAELGVGVNWLVNKLCEEGLRRIDLTGFSLVRDPPPVTVSPPAYATDEG